MQNHEATIGCKLYDVSQQIDIKPLIDFLAKRMPLLFQEKIFLVSSSFSFRV